jgi:hypothetical protein
MTAPRRMSDRFADIAAVALDALPGMFDPGSRLFSHKTFCGDDGQVNQGSNVLYSAVSLVGLLSQGRRAPDQVLPIGEALDGVHTAVGRGGSAGELANLVWACTMADDRRGEQVLGRLAEVEPRQRPSGELGQVLHGLAVGAGAYPRQRDRAMAAARACEAELLARFCPGGDVFRASPRRALPRRELLESRLTSFAAQVYPLHGLAAFHLATGTQPGDAIGRVAARIVEAQGPLGQWWWLYATRARKVLEGYPVYSVHQDGMAFLGLMELEKLGIDSFAEPLALGLEWLSGANELATDMVDRRPGLINRCIQRAGSDADGAYGISRANLLRVIGRSTLPAAIADHTEAELERLEVLRECRSYHLGWLLYADSLVQCSGSAHAEGG